jgi:hypothetical protein
MLSLTSEAEGSAELYSAVSQDCVLQAARICRPTPVSSNVLQIENLRYSPADAGRYAFGLASTFEAPKRRDRLREFVIRHSVFLSHLFYKRLTRD